MNVTGNIVGAANGSDLVVSSGVVTVSSNNSYNGPTFIQNGATLIANNASATGDGVVNIANGGKLQVGTAA
jgi:autotransporter-associated beta strand protein